MLSLFCLRHLQLCKCLLSFSLNQPQDFICSYYSFPFTCLFLDLFCILSQAALQKSSHPHRANKFVFTFPRGFSFRCREKLRQLIHLKTFFLSLSLVFILFWGLSRDFESFPNVWGWRLLSLPPPTKMSLLQIINVQLKPRNSESRHLLSLSHI